MVEHSAPYAEMHARTPNRTRNGSTAVMFTFVPEGAIIGVLYDTEFLLDPRALDNVFLVATDLRRYMPGDVRDYQHFMGQFALTGVPESRDGAAIRDWVDLGRLVAGLPSTGSRKGLLGQGEERQREVEWRR